MRVLVLGGSGMLGHKIAQRLSGRFEVSATVRREASDYTAHPAFRHVRLVGDTQAEDFDSMVRALAQTRPDAVVNCIGITKQKPEAELPIQTISLNALFPHRLAELCRSAGARLLHFSTDCVFSGQKGMYTEDDRPDPDDLYGRAKLLGETKAPHSLTLRTSIVGRELAGSHGLVEWFCSQRGRTALGYARAIYSGLSTVTMADLVAFLLERGPTLEGLWHVSSEPISKYDLLRMLNDALDLKVQLRRDETFVCDRSLDGSRFRRETGWAAPSWGEMVAGLASDPTPYAT